MNGLDSIFGHGLEKAVRAFQKVNGLAVDGIVGRATWTRLFV
ncbi:peptidoglycan-binding protein [Bacillus sp. WMMC1349]|nr:peptidoglycan-binding protein [Bacillus sp. WMMC1349]